MKRFLFSLLLVCVLLPVSGNGGTANLPSLKVLYTDDVPTNGTSEIQTITFGSGQVSGTFFLRFNNRTTPAITWSATNATLVANIDAALETLSNITSGGVTTTVGSMTAGIGTITVRFDEANAKTDVPLMTVPSKTTSGTIAVTTTTPGVTADGRNSVAGTLLVNTAAFTLYMNEGSPPEPDWQLIAP